VPQIGIKPTEREIGAAAAFRATIRRRADGSSRGSGDVSAP
jgi:hypothetical protein